MKKILTAIILLSVGPLVQAQTYWGANYSRINESADATPNSRSFDVDYSVVYLRGGFQFNEWFGAEARLGTGVSEGEVVVETTFRDVPVELEVKSLYGAFGTVSIPTGSAFIPYAIIGYVGGEVEATTGGRSITDSTSYASYGIGINIGASDGVIFNLEGLFSDVDEGDSRSLAVGFRFNF